MSYFELDTKQYEMVTEAVRQFSDGAEAERVINEFLSDEGAKLIKEGIHELLPESGRSWSGKAAAASDVDPFNKKMMNMAVQIKSKGKYHYLYFPDDGSNTIHHAGNQQFMFEGASNQAQEIGNKVIKKLLERLEV